MQIEVLQQQVDEWIKSNGGYWDRFQILARLTEELGEVASALQREAGLRPRKVATDLELEVGDLLFTLAAFANVSGIDLAQSMERVLAKYEIRDAADWQAREQTP